MTWVLDFEAQGHRAFVSPMRGARPPYRMEVTTEQGGGATFVGLPSAATCVESFVTWLRGRVDRLAPGVIGAWMTMAARIDSGDYPTPGLLS